MHVTNPPFNNKFDQAPTTSLNRGSTVAGGRERRKSKMREDSFFSRSFLLVPNYREPGTG